MQNTDFIMKNNWCQVELQKSGKPDSEYFAFRKATTSPHDTLISEYSSVILKCEPLFIIITGAKTAKDVSITSDIALQGEKLYPDTLLAKRVEQEAAFFSSAASI